METLDLKSLQNKMLAALQGDPAPFLLQANRLRIYQGNQAETLCRSLHKLYPNIVLLVGKEFFAAMADEYAQKYPATSYVIEDYGQHFADFLTAFPPVLTLPYLPEMAQLEWAAYEMQISATVEKIDLANSQINSDAKIFCFRYPIYQIWQLCKNPEINFSSIDLDSGEEKVLLFRVGFEVQIKLLTEVEANALWGQA